MIVAVIVISYFIGSISGSFLLGKLFLKMDIRNYGSGNAGTTNAMRVMGKELGVLTFLIDFLKGIVCMLVIWKIFGREFLSLSMFFCVVGHCYPFYMHFKGGKGVATTIGCLAIIDTKLAFICFLVWLGTTLIFRMVSLGSIMLYICSAIIFPIFAGLPFSSYIFIIAVAVLGIIRHTSNIENILKGKERRIGK